MLDPLIVKAISIGLGLMFVIAAYHKLVDSSGFRVTLLEYQVLPETLVGSASRVIPIVELLLGCCWLIPAIAGDLVALASAALLAAYACAIVVNLGRGRVHFDCGCGFGGKSGNEQFLSGGLVARNVILIAAALITMLPVTGRPLTAADYVTLAAALVAGALLFGAANQLMANRAAINTWRKPHE